MPLVLQASLPLWREHTDSLPQAVTCQHVLHTTLAGIEPTTFRLLVRHATSSATYLLWHDIVRFVCCCCCCSVQLSTASTNVALDGPSRSILQKLSPPYATGRQWTFNASCQLRPVIRTTYYTLTMPTIQPMIKIVGQVPPSQTTPGQPPHRIVVPAPGNVPAPA